MERKQIVERKCVICGNNLPKYASKYCCKGCKSQADNSKVSTPHGELTKICSVCGKEFNTYKSRKKTCSDDCSIKLHNSRSTRSRNIEHRKEYDRIRYLKKHPNAKTKKEICQQALENKKIRNQRADEYKAYILECQKKKIEKKEKWEELKKKPHICVQCGTEFLSEYPSKIYCSDTCKKSAYKLRHPQNLRAKKRYKGITIDSDISLFELSKRYNHQCQLCGLYVDWEDKIQTDKTIVCGDMYPSIDHIYPISLGGLHSWDNVQLAHRGCNSRKGNRFIG